MIENNIRAEILQIKQKLIELEESNKDNIVDIGMCPMDTDGIKNFPLDYQLFMEVIGELSVSWLGYQVLEIRMPYPMEEIDESESGDIMAGDLWLPWSFYPENGLYYGKPFKDYQIFAGESCSNTMYSFDTSLKPYQVINQDGESYDSFIDWFQSTMNQQIFDSRNEIKIYF